MPYLIHRDKGLITLLPGESFPKLLDKFDHLNASMYSHLVWHQGEKMKLVVVYGKNPDDPEMIDIITAYFEHTPNRVF